MNRRHFLNHLASSTIIGSSVTNFTNSILANAAEMKKNTKSVILLWMGGGPSTIDLWDLKTNTPTSGPFKPISTSADGVQICEHLPLLSQQMHHLSIVRSMSTREADHTRGRYYMHTGFVPTPTIEHPSYGSVISHELVKSVPELEVPAFVSVGGSSIGPGFLGMTYSPFVVDSNGNIRDLNGGIDQNRVAERLQMLELIEDNFISQKRGSIALEHRKVVDKTVKLMTSQQMDAFKVSKEPQEIRDKYGNTGFGRGCLMARRLVEIGVY